MPMHNYKPSTINDIKTFSGFKRFDGDIAFTIFVVQKHDSQKIIYKQENVSIAEALQHRQHGNSPAHRIPQKRVDIGVHYSTMPKFTLIGIYSRPCGAKTSRKPPIKINIGYTRIYKIRGLLYLDRSG